MNQMHMDKNSGPRVKPTEKHVAPVRGFLSAASTISELSPKRLKSLGFPFTNLLLLPGGILIATIMINLFGLALPIAMLQVYDRVIPNRSVETLATLCVALIFIAGTELILRIARSYVVSISASQFGHYATVEAVSKILQARSGPISTDHASKLLERVEAVSKLADFYGGTARLLLIDLPFSLLFLIFIGLIGGPMILIPMILICIFAVATYFHANRLRTILEQRDEQETRTFDFITQSLRGITTLKSSAMESLILRRFERMAETSAKVNNEFIQATSQAQTLAGLLGNTITISIVTIGAFLAIYDDLTIGMLAAMSQLAGRTIQPIIRTAGSWGEIQKVTVAFAEAAPLFAVPDEKIIPANIDYGRTPYLEISYLKASQPISGIRIDAGKIVSFIGIDGSGRSSLLRHLSGLENCPWLHARIDGFDPLTYRDNGHQAIGYVSQNTYALQGTIIENLTLFGACASIDDARWACEAMGISKIIHRLPDGFDTKLGTGVTERLTQGVVRRIVMARAIAQRPRVLLLDEPQAFLDTIADNTLLTCLETLKKNTTILMITNRPSYHRISDEIYEVTHDGFIRRSATQVWGPEIVIQQTEPGAA